MEDWANDDVNLLSWRAATGETAFEKTAITEQEISEQEFFDHGILMVAFVRAGVELAFDYRPSDEFTFTGMLSLGDWKSNNDLENIQVYDDSQNPIGNPYSLYIKGLKVSDAAQTTAAIGVDYQVMPRMHWTVDYNYFGNLYADFDPNDRKIEKGGKGRKRERGRE